MMFADVMLFPGDDRVGYNVRANTSYAPSALYRFRICVAVVIIITVQCMWPLCNENKHSYRLSA